MGSNSKEYARWHYKKNKELYKSRAKTHKAKSIKRNREFVKSYKLESPCLDCGEPDWIVLEFDHVKGKKRGNIGDMVNSPVGLKTLIKEMGKCEVVCANCHRRRTHKRRLGDFTD